MKHWALWRVNLSVNAVKQEIYNNNDTLRKHLAKSHRRLRMAVDCEKSTRRGQQ